MHKLCVCLSRQPVVTSAVCTHGGAQGLGFYPSRSSLSEPFQLSVSPLLGSKHFFWSITGHPRTVPSPPDFLQLFAHVLLNWLQLPSSSFFYYAFYSVCVGVWVGKCVCALVCVCRLVNNYGSHVSVHSEDWILVIRCGSKYLDD